MNGPMKMLFWAAFPAVLLTFGQWLAEQYSRSTSQVYFSAQRTKIAETFVIDLRLFNRSSQAIDELVFTPPTTGLFLAAYEPQEEAAASDKGFAWRGYLPAGKALRGLLVYRDVAGPAGEQILEAFKARTQIRVGPEGKLQWSSMSIEQGESKAYTRTVIFLLLYTGPTLIFGVVLLVKPTMKWFQRRKTP